MERSRLVRRRCRRWWSSRRPPQAAPYTELPAQQRELSRRVWQLAGPVFQNAPPRISKRAYLYVVGAYAGRWSNGNTNSEDTGTEAVRIIWKMKTIVAARGRSTLEPTIGFGWALRPYLLTLPQGCMSSLRWRRCQAGQLPHHHASIIADNRRPAKEKYRPEAVE